MILRNATRCPSDEDILHLSSGDLSPRRARRIQVHVRSCESCSGRLQRTSAALTTYAREVVRGDGNTTRRWQGFAAALQAEEDAWRRQRTMRRWWSSAAAIAAGLLVAALWYPQTEVRLDAQEVLSRAVHVAEQRPSEDQQIRIRVGAGPDRVGERPVMSGAHTQQVRDDPAAQQLSDRLAMFGFNWHSPLSPIHFQRWRESVRHEDTLTRNASVFRISTKAAEGDVESAEIIIGSETYEPVRQHWRFSDGFEVELSASEERAPTDAPSTRAAASDSRPAVSESTAVDLDSVELNLRAEVRDLGLPLGRTLLVSRGAKTVRIEGTVAEPRVRSQLLGYAHKHRGIVASVGLQETTEGEPLPSSASLDAWLVHAVGDTVLRDGFVRQTLKLETRFRAAVEAFVELAARYPAKTVARLSTANQTMLQSLVDGHYHELTDAFETLERHLAPLVGTVTRPTLPRSVPRSWHNIADVLPPDLSRLTDAVNGLLSETRTLSPPAFEDAARTAVRPALATLAATITADLP